MTKSVDDFIAGIAGRNQRGELWHDVEEWFEQDGPVATAELGIALEHRRQQLTETIGNVESTLATVIGLLTKTPGRSNVVEAVRLVEAASVQRLHLPREAASYLAACQRPGDLGAAFLGAPAGYGIDELRSCLVQELLLRGVDVAEIPEIGGWLLQPAREPGMLGWLPTVLVEIEQDPTLPSYSLYGSGHGGQLGPRHYGEPGTPRSVASPAFVNVTAQTDSRAQQAVSDWWHHSNGQSEHRAFQLERPISGASALAGSLAGFGLDCLAGLGPDDDLVVAPFSPAEVWQVLHEAAAFGGAYSHGVYGAFGRLAAWQSLAGLVATDREAPVQEVCRQVQEHTWYWFEAQTDWFGKVAWDLGLACVSPDGRRVAVLAASDTD